MARSHASGSTSTPGRWSRRCDAARGLTIPPPPRLALVRAAAAPVAVIFRRGPSKYVEVIRWDLERDVFVRGQWFRGRIYDRRSDLSPDGELLVYFAAKYI